nr:hypothetical protein [Bacteroides finegoldii]
MKKKVAFVNFWETFKPKDSLFYKILCKHFDIDLVDLAQAEYVFFSVWGDETCMRQTMQLRYILLVRIARQISMSAIMRWDLSACRLEIAICAFLYTVSILSTSCLRRSKLA